MQMHIKCIFQLCRSPGRAGSELFWFRSGSALATASYQHFIASKLTHLPGLGERSPSPQAGRVALGLAAPGPPSAGLSTDLPSQALSAPIGEPNPQGRQFPRPGRGGSSSRCRRRRRLVPSNQPRFPSSCKLLPCSFLLVPSYCQR